MNKNHDIYESPFAERYSSKEMLYNFSADKKFRTWRQLWITLAEAEKELGLDISSEQIAELKRFADKINYEDARIYEEKFKHDVMAHIHVYGKQCPKAKPIIHLGATSAYVVDNTDLVVMRDGLSLLKKELINVIKVLAEFVERYADLPTVAYTHFQPAQFTTVGKRTCLWLQDLVMDLDDLEVRLNGLKFLGAKGAVGTQASFLALFDGDEDKVVKLDKLVAKKMGFDETFIISGQTYTRKLDMLVLSTLASIAQSAHKFSNDIRLLQHLRELEEPFAEEQVGSSAMAYKRNPMKSERIASLARLVITFYQNTAMTAANQWFERTLDDSAGKRISLPEAFLGVDAILNLYYDIVSGLRVNKDIIARNVDRELPFIATENILMEGVKRGGDRQTLHEKIRRHAIASIENSKDGSKNDLLKRLNNDRMFSRIKSVLPRMLKPSNYIGRAPSQVREFLQSDVWNRVKGNKTLIGMKDAVKV